MADVFKACPGCHTTWPDRTSFLADPDVAIVGYQVGIVSPTEGLFLFNHACDDTLAIPVGAFLDLAERPLRHRTLRGTDDCEGHCLHRGDLDPCRAPCECAFVRDVLQVIRSWPKAGKPAGSPQ